MRTPFATLAMTLLVSQGVLADDNSNLTAASQRAPLAHVAKPSVSDMLVFRSVAPEPLQPRRKS
ncbi:hypothetical protein D9M68_242670 [compost metagenome]